MTADDKFSQYYSDHLDGIYDCVDRVVLNAYFILPQSGGGFRHWWRELHGDDSTLDDNHLMRYAGRFARRIRAFAEQNNIPLINCGPDERKHEIAEQFLPSSSGFSGLFCILVGRAPAPVRKVSRFGNGGMDVKIKEPYPYVNHYFFHIIDKEWGHIVIRFCPHPPFNAQIILNGHEYVERAALKKRIPFLKEGNCFTEVSDASGLGSVAEAMTSSGGVGRLVEVCERWIYTSCLVFALDLSEQESSGFRYSYSVYQAEYSRNLLFSRGKTMDQVFNSVIDRTRAPLNIKTVKTIFGFQHRPYRKDKRGKVIQPECVVERPAYDLTVFKIHYGILTVKIYSKGERVLRVEAITHNARKMGCAYGIESFPKIVEKLKAMLERFMNVLQSVNVSFIDAGRLDDWPSPSFVGSTRVGGININSPRIRGVMEAVTVLSIEGSFASSQVADKVREILDLSDSEYRPRHAAYDLKKLRGKGLVRIIDRSRKYEATEDGLSSMACYVVLLEKVVKPLLDSANPGNVINIHHNESEIDACYRQLQDDMKELFRIIGIAA